MEVWSRTFLSPLPLVSFLLYSHTAKKPLCNSVVMLKSFTEVYGLCKTCCLARFVATVAKSKASQSKAECASQ